MNAQEYMPREEFEAARRDWYDAWLRLMDKLLELRKVMDGGIVFAGAIKKGLDVFILREAEAGAKMRLANPIEAEKQKESEIAGAGDDIICRACGYHGHIDTPYTCLSIYMDCSCPICGSTDNEYNDEHMRGPQASWKS